MRYIKTLHFELAVFEADLLDGGDFEVSVTAFITPYRLQQNPDLKGPGSPEEHATAEIQSIEWVERLNTKPPYRYSRYDMSALIHILPPEIINKWEQRFIEEPLFWRIP